MVNHKMKRFLIGVLVTLLLFSPIFIVQLSKPDLHEAHIHDIQDINGIGEVLSERIVNYLDDNPNADIEDLICIEGIGEKRLKLIRREFR